MELAEEFRMNTQLYIYASFRSQTTQIDRNIPILFAS